MPSTGQPPYRLVLLGADPSLLADAREAGLARAVLSALPDSGTVDAIALLPEARARVDDVAARLAPGGLVYWEIDRRRRPTWTPSALRSKLARSGIQILDIYWVGPGFSGTSAYVSLGTAHAVAWYVRSMFVPWTWTRAAGIHALEGLTRWRPERLGRGVPRYALVAVRREEARALQAIYDLGQGPREGSVERPHVVMLVGGQGDWSRVTLLPFEADGRKPARVLKAARHPVFGSSIEREQRALTEVRAFLGPELRDSVPEPLGSYLWNGTRVGVEGFVTGRSMAISVADRRSGWEEKRSDLSAAAGWLAEMHVRSLAGSEPWGRASRTEMVEAPLRRYAGVFGVQDTEGRLFEETRRASEDLEGIPFPRVRWHRDFQPTNVFRDGNAVRVVDWEVSAEGPALIDLIYFLIHWAWRACGARSESARRTVFRELFVDMGEGRAARAAREEIARYRERLGIDPRFVPIFVLVTMIELALDRSARLRDQGRPDWSERAANPHAAYVGLLAGRE